MAIAFRRFTMLVRLAFAAVFAAATLPALAAPSRIVILRHGEKADSWKLCATGERRADALAANYLGKGAANSLFSDGAPDAFLAITLHTLELAAPAVASWGQPMVLWSAVPETGTTKAESTAALNVRTREAVADLMGNPRFDGKTIVMVWEHDHIANTALDAAHLDAPVTLYRLLKLDRFKDVPETWPGANYDYFLDVAMDSGIGAPTAVKVIRQVFPAPYGDIPSNEWGEPNGLTEASGCER
jgi:hypothetical protein